MSGSKHEMIYLKVDLLSALNLAGDLEQLAQKDFVCTCTIKGGNTSGGKSRELFKTKAVKGAAAVEWNHTQICKDFMTDDALMFRIWCDDEQYASASLPYNQFKNGFDETIGLHSNRDEEMRESGNA